ncbi:MAG TPA: protein translocase subunit SecD, partial [Dehalococcoidia bacterium]|nr:protein translocase subunit SecD [Dehalococcoidia bacterium]
KKNIYLLIFILILFGFALWSIVPVNTKLLGSNGLTLGLDLKGGSQLLYRADLSKKDPSVTDAEAMASVIEKIQRRVNEYGAAEPVIQKQGTDRILAQLPGVEDISEAIGLIGKTALLDFREQELDAAGNPVLDDKGNWVFQDEPAKAEGRDGKERELTGEYLTRAHRDIDPYQGPVVIIEWDSEGGYLFEKITERNLQKPLAIFLDNVMISAPIVQSIIRAGTPGQIEGNFTIGEAENLAIQLNSGALDMPLTIIDQRDVDASLGTDSIRKSVLAAEIGVILLLLFMLLYYRLPGLIACFSLGIYGVFLLAIFNLFSSNITLTLPGIAAAILSLGMAVDANILIFERMKDELRTGRTLGAAVEAGFNRAWTAIRDSNITTFIACIILFWLGGTFGAFMVRGFALTLFIGVALSMFTAIVITRTFLRLIVSSRLVTDPAAYGVMSFRMK